MDKYLAVAEGSQIDAYYGVERRYRVLGIPSGKKGLAEDHSVQDVSEI